MCFFNVNLRFYKNKVQKYDTLKTTVVKYYSMSVVSTRIPKIMGVIFVNISRFNNIVFLFLYFLVILTNRW